MYFLSKILDNVCMNIALVLAAGKSLRMKSDKGPKQFLKVNGLPVFMYSVKAFQDNKNIDKIVIVTLKEFVKEVAQEAHKHKINKLHSVIVGGETRQESVFRGLKALKDIASDNDIVLIHDSARPLVSQRIIDDNVKVAKKENAAMTVISPNDTIIVGKENELLDKTLNRDELFLVQTPQSFKYSLILNAHEEAFKNGVKNAFDDASLVSRLNKEVKFVKGEKSNIKITTPEDLEMVSFYLNK